MMTETRIETYIPLYRKYRPQSFADMVGQEAIVQTLGNAINLNKVAHAYLFCGPRGTGKTSTARIFAKSLNCERGPTVAPCQQCASCVGIANGNALDVIEFDAASNNGVADARELIENCQYSSMTGRFKVYIIDEVHMLTPQAFNALLKTLEEPPANVIFIFATTEAHKVLPTIISRCQRFDFNRITTENIVSRLQFIAERESISIDAEALLSIARHARGGLRDAVGLLDQVAVLGRAQQGKIIGRKDVAMFIGSLEEDLLLRLGSAIGERRAADLLSELGELLNRGIEPIQLLKDLTLHFRNLLIVSTAGPTVNPDALSLPPDYFEQLITQVQLFPEAEEIPQIIGRLASVERNIRNSSQPQLWLEVGLIELAYRHEIHLVKELSERIAKLEAQLAGQSPSLAQASAPDVSRLTSAQVQAKSFAPQQSIAPSLPSKSADMGMPSLESTLPLQSAQPPQPPAAQPASTRSVSAPAALAGSLDAQYNQACSLVPSLPFRSLLQQQTFPISLTDDQLTVGCVSETHQTTIKKPEKFIHLQKAVDKAFGRPIRIEVVLEKKRPATSSVVSVSPAPLQPIIEAVTPQIQPKPMAAETSHSVIAPVLTMEPQVEATLTSSSAVAVLEPPVPAPHFGPADSALGGSGHLSQNASLRADMPPLDLDAPPLVDNEGPVMDEDESESPSPGLSPRMGTGESVSAAVVSLGGDPELQEAKKNVIEVLHGRVIE